MSEKTQNQKEVIKVLSSEPINIQSQKSNKQNESQQFSFRNKNACESDHRAINNALNNAIVTGFQPQLNIENYNINDTQSQSSNQLRQFLLDVNLQSSSGPSQNGEDNDQLIFRGGAMKNLQNQNQPYTSEFNNRVPGLAGSSINSESSSYRQFLNNKLLQIIKEDNQENYSSFTSLNNKAIQFQNQNSPYQSRNDLNFGNQSNKKENIKCINTEKYKQLEVYSLQDKNSSYKTPQLECSNYNSQNLNSVKSQKDKVSPFKIINKQQIENNKSSEIDQKKQNEEYVRIFQSLLDESLTLQHELLILIHNNTTKTNKNNILNDNFNMFKQSDLQNCLIDPKFTKSFKELCNKALQQYAHAISFLKSKCVQVVQKEKEVFDLKQNIFNENSISFQNQQQLQNDILIKIQFIADQNKEIEKLRSQINKQNQQLLKSENEKQICLHQLDQFKIEQESKNENDKNIKVQNINEGFIEKENIIRNLQHQLKEVQNERKREQQNSTDLQNLVFSLQEQNQEQQNLRSSQIKAHENLQMMYNISRDSIKLKEQEIDDLKIKIQESIKENLQLETGFKIKIDELDKEKHNQIKLKNDLQSQIQQHNNNRLLEKQDFELRILKEKEEYKQYFEKQYQEIRCRYEMSESQNLQFQNQIHNLNKQLNEAINDQNIQKGDVSHYQEKLNSIIRENEQFKKQNQLLNDEINDIQLLNKEMKQQIFNFQDEMREVQGLDLQISLVKDRCGNYLVSQYKKSKNYQHKNASLLNVNNQKQKGKSQEKFIKDNDEVQSSLLDLASNFTNQYHGVHGFSQAINQAKIIEQIIMQKQKDEQQHQKKSQIIKEFSKKFGEFELQIQGLINEKSTLEQLILEILSFGEQCDQHFEQLQDKINKFQNQYNNQNVKNTELLKRLKYGLTEIVKSIIIDMEDKTVRDKMIDIISQINSNFDINKKYEQENSEFQIGNKIKKKQNSIQIDKVYNLIIEQLGQHCNNLQKELNEKNLQLKEIQPLQDKIREIDLENQIQQSNLEQTKEQYRKLRENMQDIDIIVKKIIMNISEHQNILENTQLQKHNNRGYLRVNTERKKIERYNELSDIQYLRKDKHLKSDQKVQYDKYQFQVRSVDDSMKLQSLEQLCVQLPKDLHYISEWSNDQIMLVHNFIIQRDKTLQLNLKLNQIQKENSQLSIEINKQKNINEKYLKMKSMFDNIQYSLNSSTPQEYMKKDFSKESNQFLSNKTLSMQEYDQMKKTKSNQSCYLLPLTQDTIQNSNQQSCYLFPESKNYNYSNYNLNTIKEQNEDPLHQILSKVQTLRTESDPNRYFVQNDQNNKVLHQDYQISNQQNFEYQQNDSLYEQFDQKGSFDLVNQSDSEQQYQNQGEYLEQQKNYQTLQPVDINEYQKHENEIIQGKRKSLTKRSNDMNIYDQNWNENYDYIDQNIRSNSKSENSSCIIQQDQESVNFQHLEKTSQFISPAIHPSFVYNQLNHQNQLFDRQFIQNPQIQNQKMIKHGRYNSTLDNYEQYNLINQDHYQICQSNRIPQQSQFLNQLPDNLNEPQQQDINYANQIESQDQEEYNYNQSLNYAAETNTNLQDFNTIQSNSCYEQSTIKSQDPENLIQDQNAYYHQYLQPVFRNDKSQINQHLGLKSQMIKDSFKTQESSQQHSSMDGVDHLSIKQNQLQNLSSHNNQNVYSQPQFHQDQQVNLRFLPKQNKNIITQQQKFGTQQSNFQRPMHQNYVNNNQRNGLQEHDKQLHHFKSHQQIDGKQRQIFSKQSTPVHIVPANTSCQNSPKNQEQIIEKINDASSKNPHNDSVLQYDQSVPLKVKRHQSLSNSNYTSEKMLKIENLLKDQQRLMKQMEQLKNLKKY